MKNKIKKVPCCVLSNNNTIYKLIHNCSLYCGELVYLADHLTNIFTIVFRKIQKEKTLGRAAIDRDMYFLWGFLQSIYAQGKTTVQIFIHV